MFTNEARQITAGFVYYDANDPAFEFWLALRLGEFNEPERSVESLRRALESSDFYNQVKDAMASTLEAATFEESRNDGNIGGVFEETLQHPKAGPFQAAGLFPAEVCATWWFRDGKQAEKRAFSTEACQKAKMLDYIRSGKRVRREDTEINAGRCRLRGGAPEEEFAWDWSVGSGIRYYFIPLKYLP